MGSHGPASAQLSFMERELETQMKESMEESQALREKFRNDLGCLREDSKRRLVERNYHAKKQQAKWKEHASCIEREKAELVQQAELLQEQLIGSTREVCLARERMFQLEAETQSMRSRPPQVIERADPGAAVEIMRLRDRTSATEEQARRAQRDAAEAREAMGKESAINQGFQREIDGARHRLLTVQSSLAEMSEENTGLRRELESERIKTIAGSRRLEDAVQRQDNALVEVRRDSAQLREERDRLAQDSAILRIKLRQSKKREATRRLFHALSQVAQGSLARALRALAVAAMVDVHSRMEGRQQEEHASEVASLETDLHRAETRNRDALRRVDRLLESRETVASFAVQAYRRRQQGTIFASAVAEKYRSRLAIAQRWCFWGWARVTHSGCAAVARRARRVEVEKEIIGVREMLSAAVEKIRGAEAERNQHGARAQALGEKSRQQTAELEVARAALNATQSMASSVRNRFGRLGALRLQKTLEQNRRFRLARALAALVHVGDGFPSGTIQPPGKCNSASLDREKDVTTTSAKSTEAAREVMEETAGAQPEPEVPRRRSGCKTSQLSDGTPTPIVSSSVQHDSSPIDSGAKRVERVVDTRDVGEDTANLALPIAMRGGTAHNKQPRTNLPSVVEIDDSLEGDERDGDGLNSGVAKNSDTNVPLVTTFGDHSAVHRHQRDAGSSRATLHSISTWTSCEQPGIQEQGTPFHELDPVVGGFPFPARTRTPPSTTTPNLTTTRNAEVDDIAHVSHHNGGSGDAAIVTTPGSGRASGWSAIPGLPRAILALRAAVGQELYAVGERLLRCVEADHREVHGRRYHAIPITRAEREQFHVCLEDASHGSMRRVVLAFLKVQESYRAIAVERDHGDGVKARGGGGDRFPSARGKRKDTWDTGERQHELSSLTTGPLSSPAEKARAARVLRDRLVSLLDDADEAWDRHRRPREKVCHMRGTRQATKTTGLSHTQRRTTSRIAGHTAKAKSTNADRRLNRDIDDGREVPSPASRRSLRYLDSGAGPRAFWETVAGPRLVEASWAMNFEGLEQQLWDLAMLVRDRGEERRTQGGRREILALNRRQRFRRILDVRVYELLLMHVRTRLIWDGIDNEHDDDAGRDGNNFKCASLLEAIGGCLGHAL